MPSIDDEEKRTSGHSGKQIRTPLTFTRRSAERLWTHLGHCQNQIRPLGVETGQYPTEAALPLFREAFFGDVSLRKPAAICRARLSEMPVSPSPRSPVGLFPDSR